MSSKYPFFKFISGSSKIHIMNSKMKIIWFLLCILISLLLRDFITLSIFLLYLLFIMKESDIPLNAYISNLFILWPLFTSIFMIALFLTFDFTNAFYLVLKIIFIILIFLILTFTTSLSEIAWGFDCTFTKLKKIGIPVSKWSLKVAMGIKFISTLFEQFKAVRKSMAYRGVSYKKNGFKAAKNMFIPVIKLSYKLSTRMISAMKMRFYGNSRERTNYHENKVTKFDKYIVLASVVIIYISLYLGWF